jgi:cytochrome P450
MRPITELQLPYLPVEDAAFAVDPMPYIEAARRQHTWLARCSFGYVVHEYAAIRDLSYMDDRFRPSMDTITQYMGANGTPWGEFMDNLMLAKTGPEHLRLRSSVSASFTPKNINRYRALMRERVSQLLDEWAPKAGFDFTEFAACFPITVMFGLMGASLEQLPGIRRSLETQGLSANLIRSLLPDLEAAYQVLWKFVHELIVARQRNGGGEEEDVLNTLIAAKAAGRLNDAELHNLLIFLFAAGYDTSKNMLTLIMHTMIQHPDYWARCAQDRPFCDRVVEEMLRHTSVSSLYRMSTQDVLYRDVLFPVNTLLFMPLNISGRDPAAFPDPMEFQPERSSTNRYMAFGRGVHMCLGQHLARAQIQEGIHLIAQRITRPRLAGPVTWRPFPGVWGIRSLPIAFEPGLRRDEHN